MWNFNPNTAYLDLVWYKIHVKTSSLFFSKAVSGAYPILQLNPSIDLKTRYNIKTYHRMVAQNCGQRPINRGR